MLAALFVLLDAAAPLPAWAHGVRWIDLTGLGCLAWGVDWGAWRRGEHEGTPLDGLLLGAIAFGLAQAIATSGRDGGAEVLVQALAGSAMFVGLTSALRRTPAAIETTWRALAVAGVAIGAASVWGGATGGLAGLARQEALADARWVGHHALAKSAAFLTLALAGRAFERDAAPVWRLATLLAATGAVLHAVAGGYGLGEQSLARLDDPVFFSSLSLTLLLVVAVSRGAWDVARERRRESRRWRVLALATAAVGVGGVLGGASGGEGARMFVGLAAAVVVAVTGVAEPAVAAVPEAAPAAAAPTAPAAPLELHAAEMPPAEAAGEARAA